MAPFNPDCPFHIIPSFMAIVLALFYFVQGGGAQIGYNANTNSLLCSKPGGHYCVHGSLQGPTMISCVSTTTAEIRSCNIELANILPPGYKDLATCYETAPILGDALCAFNGTGYPRSGKPIPIPETAICTADSSPEGSDSNSDEQGAVDIDSGSDGDEAADSISPSPLEDHHAESIPAPRKRSHGPEPENPLPTSPPPCSDDEKFTIQPITTRPDNEKGTVQPMPSLTLPPPNTTTTPTSDSTPSPTEPLTVPSTLTTTAQPKPTTTPSQPVCVSLVRVEGPNSTIAVYSTGCATGSVTPTRRRPKLADKCTWTPVPMYRTGASMGRISSLSLSYPQTSGSVVVSPTSRPSLTFTSSASVNVTESGGGVPAKTSTVMHSGADSVERTWCGRVGFAVLLGLLVGWGLVLG